MTEEIQEKIDVVAAEPGVECAGDGMKISLDGKYKGLWITVDDEPSWDMLERWADVWKSPTDFKGARKLLPHIISGWNFSDKKRLDDVLNHKDSGVYLRFPHLLVVQICEKIGEEVWSNSKSS